MNWWKHAACAGTDAELFFPIGDGPAVSPQIEAAKAVCRGCPVRPQCLAYALSTNVTGVWGGFAEQERRHLREIRTRDRLGVPASR
jgi:WhiB family transcriptional regulator, redox-sensing transcriptional regulator